MEEELVMEAIDQPLDLTSQLPDQILCYQALLSYIPAIMKYAASTFLFIMPARWTETPRSQELKQVLPSLHCFC